VHNYDLRRREWYVIILVGRRCQWKLALNTECQLSFVTGVTDGFIQTMSKLLTVTASTTKNATLNWFCNFPSKSVMTIERRWSLSPSMSLVNMQHCVKLSAFFLFVYAIINLLEVVTPTQSFFY
jgi:hypothetical protein